MTKEKDVVEALFAPTTIGELKKFIDCMDPTTPVFAFSVGNKDGVYSWKRKETWKQWRKLCQKSETGLLNRSPSANLKKCSET